jgi:hypothetical protein
MSSRTRYDRVAKTAAYNKIQRTIRQLQYNEYQLHDESNCNNIVSPIVAKSFNAEILYYKKLRQINIDILRNYLNESDNADVKYIVIPEMMKFIIANPSIILYHPHLRDSLAIAVGNCEKNINTVDKIGNVKISEQYRDELRNLITTTKNIITLYSNLNLKCPSTF